MPIALAGHLATELQAARRLSNTLSPALEGRDLIVTGVVASLPQRSSSGLRVRFRVESASLAGSAVTVPPLVSLGWYRGWHEDAESARPLPAVAAGQRWRLTVRRQSHGSLNPHGFDFERHAFERGLRATRYVRDAPAALLAQGVGHRVDRLRQRVRDAIDRTVPERRTAGVLAALAVGDQSAIDRKDWQLFRSTGVAHLVAINGLHITMFAWLAGAMVSTGWRRWPRGMLAIPAPQAATFGGLLAATLYAVGSGWGIPAQRTIWMLLTVTLLRWGGARWPWPLVLLLAAVAVTLVDPWALLQPGFWLSFAAIALLMGAVGRPTVAAGPGDGSQKTEEQAPAWRRALRGLWVALRSNARTQAIVSLGLAPLTLVLFQQVSLVGMLANLIAIPLVTLLVTPMALLGTLVAPLWTVGAWAVQALTAWLAWLASWPHAVWSAPAAPAWAQAAGLLAAALGLLPLPWRLRLLALPLLLPMLMPSPDRPPEGHFELTAVDVGQGTAVLVRTRRHLLVYDAGPQYGRDSDAGDRVLLPLLRARGEPRIDALMLSHRDADHVGGARALLGAMPVGAMLSSLEAAHPLRVAGPPHTHCVAGTAWTWDGVGLEIMAPQATAYRLDARPNALSCVLRIASAEGHVALLTGDIERAQERALVGSGEPDRLRSDVLLVPHHGSRTSSTEAFLAAVQPRTAVVQAGYRNRFGHPAADVRARYAARGIALVETTRCGAWRWRSTAPGVGYCHRDAARRYWHHRLVESPAEQVAPADARPRAEGAAN